jgi:two-component system, NtrC family, sensor kinase
MTPTRIVAWMVTIVALLGIASYWDERRMTEAALADFGASQAMMADAAAETLRVVAEGRHGHAGDLREEVAPRVGGIERPGMVEIFLRRPGQSGLESLDGSLVRSTPIEAAFAAGLSGDPWLRLTHPEAVALGLPSRTAMVGLTEVDLGADGRWGLAVAASARHERDREERSLWHVALSFVLASAIIITFGTFALRKQRTELELAKRLAVAEAVQARDERLVRADKLATLGAMALGIAHQVATPLWVIMGRAERLARRVTDDEKASHAVSAIVSQARRINEIIRAFLQLARGGTPTLVHTSPATLARGAVELVGHRFEKAGVNLRAELGEGLPAVACDPRLFEQVVVNLLLNACDACSPGGQVTLAVEASERAVSFTVEDDGVGISPSSAKRATEPFFTTKAADEGSGLGLAIAHEIVGHHHGTLEVVPLSGKGTRARVEIPLPAILVTE